MKDKLNPVYFSHDTQSQNDYKIIALISRFGVEGYGYFWILVELMHYYNGSIKMIAVEGIAKRFDTNYESLREIINFCITLELFYLDEDYLKSTRVDDNLLQMKANKTTKSKAGEAGALKRWNKTKEIKK